MARNINPIALKFLNAALLPKQLLGAIRRLLVCISGVFFLIILFFSTRGFCMF